MNNKLTNKQLEELREEQENSEKNAVYIEPDIEEALSEEKKKECFHIVKEIKEFGVSQRQILFLLGLLALELEDNELTNSIVKLVKQGRKTIGVSRLILPDNKS